MAEDAVNERDNLAFLIGMNSTVIIRQATAADAPAIAQVHISSWRSTYPGIVPQDYIDKFTIEERTRRWADRLAHPPDGLRVYVAEDETAGMVGFVSGGPEREGNYDGEISAIYIVKEHQRHGIGRRLIQAVAKRLANDGIKSILVWVLAENPSRDFYKALGGKPVAQKKIEMGEPLDEIGYLWPDVGVLTGNL